MEELTSWATEYWIPATIITDINITLKGLQDADLWFDGMPVMESFMRVMTCPNKTGKKKKERQQEG